MKKKLSLILALVLSASFLCGAACDHSFDEWLIEGEEMSAVCTRCDETVTQPLDRELVARTLLMGKWVSPEDGMGISHALTFKDEVEFERAMLMMGMEKTQSGTWAFEAYEEGTLELDGAVVDAEIYSVSFTVDNGSLLTAQLFCSEELENDLLVFTVGEGEYALSIFMEKEAAEESQQS